MNPYPRRLAFGYSTQCNLNCGHCVAVDDTPAASTMALAEARTAVQELAFSDVKGISFTAGEPLLFLKELIELVRICAKHKIYTRVVTNGFWAKTPALAGDVVAELRTAGLSQLRISSSRWHQKQLSRQHIIHAAEASRMAGLDYFISFVTDFSGKDDSLEQFFQDNRLRYYPEPMIYFGRAGDLNRPKVSTDFYPNTCDMNPYLSPELNMFACCDAAGRFRKTGFLSLGNVKNSTIEELFQRYERNKVYALIKTAGLTALASHIGMKASEIVNYRKCELCEKLFDSPKNLRFIEQAAASDATRWVR
ncbi:MAG: radical SAM protein [Desulfobacteraceae bacterium]|nr:radical SAM protein [Desulfobacteraceae bacterium]